MSDIPTKWEWIAEKCEELGLKKAKEIAEKIDKILKEIYDKRHTRSWTTGYKYYENEFNSKTTKEEKISVIWEVAHIVDYCVACEVEESCVRCKFAKEAGCCDSEGSLFDEFHEELLEVM